MSCCTPSGYRSIFGSKTAARDARRYREKGLLGTAAWLRDALVGEGVDDRSLLEIGGGVGTLQLDLLAAGAASATNVEIIDSYEEDARVLINERDLQRRVDRVVGDIVQDADLAPPADIVILHRVICCYPDAAGMMTAACMHAGDRIALTVPRNALWIRLGFAVMNAWLRLRRVAFRAYVHEPQQLFDTATAHGFALTGHTAGLLWQCAILRRQDSSPSA
jgi:hypothetical protein